MYFQEKINLSPLHQVCNINCPSYAQFAVYITLLPGSLSVKVRTHPSGLLLAQKGISKNTNPGITLVVGCRSLIPRRNMLDVLFPRTFYDVSTEHRVKIAFKSTQ